MQTRGIARVSENIAIRAICLKFNIKHRHCQYFIKFLSYALKWFVNPGLCRMQSYRAGDDFPFVKEQYAGRLGDRAAHGLSAPEFPSNCYCSADNRHQRSMDRRNSTPLPEAHASGRGVSDPYLPGEWFSIFVESLAGSATHFAGINVLFQHGLFLLLIS